MAEVVPKVGDALQPVTLKQAGLSGEIGRRINDLIYKNYMALDLDRDFVEPFRSRPFTGGTHYVGVGKVIDAGSLFSAYTDDPFVAERTSRLIEEIVKTRDADGYIGTFKPEPEAFQNHRNWALHEQEYLLLGLTRNWLVTGNGKALQYARELGDYVIRTFSKDTKPEEVSTAGLPEAFLVLYKCTGEARYLTFAAEVRHGNGTLEIQCASLREWKQTVDTRPAHVYVMLARCYAQTELYRQEGQPALLAMSRYMRNELLRPGGGLNVVGSASDGEYFSYTQNGAGSIGESCVTAYLLRWLDSLLRLEGALRGAGSCGTETPVFCAVDRPAHLFRSGHVLLSRQFSPHRGGTSAKNLLPVRGPWDCGQSVYGLENNGGAGAEHIRDPGPGDGLSELRTGGLPCVAVKRSGVRVAVAHSPVVPQRHGQNQQRSPSLRTGWRNRV